MNPLEAFEYSAGSARIIFGSGTLAKLPEIVAEQGHALVDQLGDRCVGVYAGAAMHTPTDVSEIAVARAKQAGADCLVAIGGGSTTGLSKALVPAYTPMAMFGPQCRRIRTIDQFIGYLRQNTLTRQRSGEHNFGELH